MANTTIVYFNKTWECNEKTTYIFRTISPKRDILFVTSFKDGIVTIKPGVGGNIQTFSELISGCFNKESNFAEEMSKAFYGNYSTSFTAIKFTFNGITVMVTNKNANKNKIYAEWLEGLESNMEKDRLDKESYRKIKSSKKLKIEFKNEDAAIKWKKLVEVNSSNLYNFAIVAYARRWAKYMQYLMKEENKTIDEIAESTSITCDIVDISGYMYNCALNMLVECWKYGEELRKWHAKRYQI